jgi:hypothetical protein
MLNACWIRSKGCSLKFVIQYCKYKYLLCLYKNLNHCSKLCIMQFVLLKYLWHACCELVSTWLEISIVWKAIKSNWQWLSIWRRVRKSWKNLQVRKSFVSGLHGGYPCVRHDDLFDNVGLTCRLSMWEIKRKSNRHVWVKARIQPPMKKILRTDWKFGLIDTVARMQVEHGWKEGIDSG